MGKGKFRIQFKSVRTKLLASFGVVCVLLAIVGALGISKQSTIRTDGDRLYNDVTVPITDLAKTRANALKSRVALFNEMLAPTDALTAKYEQQFSEALAAVKNAQQSYRAHAADAATADVFAAAWNDFESVATNKALPIARRTDPARFDDFQKLSEGELGPKFTKVSSAIDDLLASEMKAGAELAHSAANTADSARTFTIALVLLGVGIAFGFGVVIARGVSRPLGESAASLDALARKDLTKTLEVTTVDETGRMAKSLNTAVGELRGALGTIDESAASLATATEELSAVSTQIGANSEETANQTNVVAAASEQVSQNVATVAAAVEEMTASIGEISQSASEAAVVAGQAVEIAARTNDSVTKLGDSSNEIGNVVKLITSIAEQTNLLALNATIEAARAGDAGKGFAVVANEVKDLANETAKATSEIASKVDAIQADTVASVDAIGQISEIIARISEIQTGIAGAVEEQAATTTEIGRSVAEAAKGVTEISENITSVATAAQDTAEGVGTSQGAVNELNRMATSLKELVAEFTY
jgi:methyl-accepting chemotaxis protein